MSTIPSFFWVCQVLVHSDHCAKKLLPWFDGPWAGTVDLGESWVPTGLTITVAFNYPTFVNLDPNPHAVDSFLKLKMPWLKGFSRPFD